MMMLAKLCFCTKLCRTPSRTNPIKPLWWIISRNGVLILVYYLLSIGLTFYQNHLLKEIKYPLTIVLCHLIIKFMLASLIRLIYELCTKKYRVMLDCKTWFYRLALIGIAGGLDIGLSNWSQEFVTVSLYTMTKSTAIVFILGFAILLKLEEMHWSLVFVVGLISGGLCMFTYKSTQFHLEGFLLVIAASFVSGVRWSTAQLIMQKSKLGLSNPIDMIFHVQPWMICSVLPFAIFFEGQEVIQNNSNFQIESTVQQETLIYTINAVLIGAVMAFCMEIAEFLLLHYTSSLTLAIAGIFKEICILGLAVIINNDQMTTVNFMGLLLCLTGITCHVIFKFARSAHECDASASNGTPRSRESPGREALVMNRVEEVNFPLLDKIEYSREYDTEEDH